MAHIANIGAGMFSDLSIALATEAEIAALSQTKTAFDGEFTAEETDFVRVMNVREFPSMGVPANIVNVPSYGRELSQQVQGQADAPSLELTLNYIPGDWAAGSTLDGLKAQEALLFRFALMNKEPAGYGSVIGANDLASVGNSYWYWIGKIESLLVNPQLTDANTATLTLSLQSKFFGAYTMDVT
jgi:hypothetical protein